jgi:ATP-dependent Lon protease
MKQACESLPIVPEFLSRILEDRSEFEPLERPMIAGKSRFEAAFRILSVGRWDYAFDVVWNSSKAAKVVSDAARPQALIVRNSGNHALGREFSEKMADRAARAKRPGLQIAWQMLASNPDKPETILRFAPQLAFAFSAEARDAIAPTAYAMSVQSLDRWIEAAEGGFRGAKMSMFTMQFTGMPKAAVVSGLEKSAERAAAVYESALIPAPIDVLQIDAAPPGVTVMTILTASKLHAEQAHFKDLLDAHLPLSITPDLTPIRYQLLAQYPHAEAAIDLLLRDLRAGKPARMNPVLLVGPPGAGKSRLFRIFTQAAGLESFRFDASSIADSIAFSGTAKAWGHTQASIPARAILTTRVPNPVILIDEIDKAAAAGGHNGSLFSSLLPFLERETSARHRDVSLDAEMNLSWISYIATANDDSKLPAHIKDRFRVIRIPAPKLEHLAALAYNVQADMALVAGDDPQWIEPLQDDELEVAGAAWAKAKFSLRALQKIVQATVDARARFPGMRH